MDSEYQEIQKLPWKAKVAYELVFLNAIMDCRKARMEKPATDFANSVLALKLVLLPKERKKIDRYELDPDTPTNELINIEQKIMMITNENLRNKTRLNELKKISFPLYCYEIDRLYTEKKLEDKNFDGVTDKIDATIMKYEGFMEKILDVLKEGGWILKSRDKKIYE